MKLGQGYKAEVWPGAGGLIFETDGDACRLAWGCKFWILVSLKDVLGKVPTF